MPPRFPVSNKCCVYAKKKTSAAAEKELGAQLNIIGVRKAEGGIRARAYKDCYSRSVKRNIDSLRPLFWFDENDKRWYEQTFGIIHSKCYTKYGFVRTGCSGCPYNKRLFDDLDATKEHEPQMHKCACAVFSDSYEWTRGYHAYIKEQWDIRKKATRVARNERRRQRYKERKEAERFNQSS